MGLEFNSCVRIVNRLKQEAIAKAWKHGAMKVREVDKVVWVAFSIA